jgi:hypothetical protein
MPHDLGPLFTHSPCSSPPSATTLPRHAMCMHAGAMLAELCHGCDTSPVTPHGPSKAVSVEDSFRACSTMHGVQVRTAQPHSAQPPGLASELWVLHRHNYTSGLSSCHAHRHTHQASQLLLLPVAARAVGAWQAFTGIPTNLGLPVAVHTCGSYL